MEAGVKTCTKPRKGAWLELTQVFCLSMMGVKQDSTGQLNDVLEWSVIPPIKTVTANDNFAFAEDVRIAA